MINLRDKNQALPAGLLLVAVLVAIGTLLYTTLVPVPSTASVAANEKSKIGDDTRNTTKAKQNLAEKLKLIDTYAFSGHEQDADSTILGLVTQFTIKRNLKLVGFRPQRPVDAGQLTQLPYLVSVSGKYPDVVAFTSDLESKGTKLAVNLVQLAASDTSTDNVTGNINVVGYLNQPLTSGAQNG